VVHNEPVAVEIGLATIWIGIDSRKQGWHDKLAGTVVIRINASVPVTFEAQE